MSPTLPPRPLRVQSDARLLQLARRGETSAFEVLVRRHRRQLLGYCRRIGMGDVQAEDALQQGLLHAWRALHRGDDVHDVKSWLYRVVHNAALDALRRPGRDHVELDEDLHGDATPSAAGEVERRMTVHATLTELASLPDMQREALVRTAVHGDSHDQVASALGLSNAAVRGLVHRARIAMRTAAGAVIPGRAVQWLLRSGSGAGTGGADLGAGAAGGGGMLAALAKGGAVLVTGGMLATGIVAVEHRRAAHGLGLARRATAQAIERGADRPAPTGSTVVSGSVIASALRRADAVGSPQVSSRLGAQPRGRRPGLGSDDSAARGSRGAPASGTNYGAAGSGGVPAAAARGESPGSPSKARVAPRSSSRGVVVGRGAEDPSGGSQGTGSEGDRGGGSAHGGASGSVGRSHGAGNGRGGEGHAPGLAAALVADRPHGKGNEAGPHGAAGSQGHGEEASDPGGGDSGSAGQSNAEVSPQGETGDPSVPDASAATNGSAGAAPPSGGGAHGSARAAEVHATKGS